MIGFFLILDCGVVLQLANNSVIKGREKSSVFLIIGNYNGGLERCKV